MTHWWRLSSPYKPWECPLTLSMQKTNRGHQEQTSDTCSYLLHSCEYVLMRVASDNATPIKANVCHLSVWRSVQQIGVEKCRSNYLAESEQVPLPATALIASALLQISNQANIGIAGIQMRWWDVSPHQNVRIWTVAVKTTRVNPNKLLSLIDPGGKDGDFTFKWNCGGRVKNTRCFKNLSWFIKKSLSPESRGNRINLSSQCMCVSHSWVILFMSLRGN